MYSQSRRAMPIALATSLLTKIAGPSLGLGLASICLNIYVNPNQRPAFSEDDLRWVGAWWIGPLVIGFLIFVCSLVIMLFPRRLPQPDNQRTDADIVEEARIKEQEERQKLPQKGWNQIVSSSTTDSLKRLFTNKIFVLNLMAASITVFVFSGFGTFMPKFYQLWFRFRASSSNTAILGHIVGQLLGMVASGFVLFKFRPRAVSVQVWNLLGGLCMVVGLFINSQTSCERAPWIRPGEILDDCISNCDCDKNDYNPICLEEIGLNFYSACAAGCSEFGIDKATNAVSYGGCRCLHQHTNDTLYYGHPSKEVRSILLALDPRGPSQSISSQEYQFTAIKGECPSNDESCYHSFYLFTGITAIVAFFASSGKVGSILIHLRAIEVRDKTMAMALMSAVTALLGQLPGPLIFGYLYDLSCTRFRDQESQTGDCLQYDNDLIKNYVVKFAASVTIISLCLDVVLLFIVKKGQLDLYLEPAPPINAFNEAKSEKGEEAETSV